MKRAKEVLPFIKQYTPAQNSETGRLVKSVKDGRFALSLMENLARIFKAQREYGRACTARGRKARSRVSYSEDIGSDDTDNDS